jgi:hypothetical protein
MKEIVHIYVRCSTEKQIENSIQRQIEEGIKYSKERGLDYKIYNDEGKSGIKSYEDNREQLQNLFVKKLGVNLKVDDKVYLDSWLRIQSKEADSSVAVSPVSYNSMVVLENKNTTTWDFIETDDIDGVLIGGASKEASSFQKIINTYL